MRYRSVRWPAAGTSAPVLQPFDCFISSLRCRCVWAQEIYSVYVRMCVCMYTLKRAKAFQLPHGPPGCPGTAGEEARDITQLLNCYLQVSPSAGLVLIEVETPSRSKAIHTHTYPSGRGVRGLASWLRLPGLMGRNKG